MRSSFTILSLLLIAVLATLGIPAGADQKNSSRNSNVAFYEGDSLTYVIYPPDRFKLVISEAIGDGYSMAFIPDTQDYRNTSAMVSINILRNSRSRRADLLEKYIVEDTAEMRAFYGDSVLIQPVDSILNANGDILPSFFIEDKSYFLPHVMSSYYSNPSSNEIIVFELHIGESYPRFAAEETYVDCIRRFKALKKGDLSEQ